MTKRSKIVHAAQVNRGLIDKTACGRPASADRSTTDRNNVTCRNCRRILGIGLTWAQGRQTGRKPPIRITTPKNLAKQIEHTMRAITGEATHPDDIAIDLFADEMKRKMRAKRAEGRSGWDDPKQVTIVKLMSLLRAEVRSSIPARSALKHIDPVDVGNYAMMIYTRLRDTK